MMWMTMLEGMREHDGGGLECTVVVMAAADIAESN